MNARLRGERSALFAIFLAGCAAEARIADGSSVDGAVTDDELIGGAAAKSASYDAVGAFVHGDTRPRVAAAPNHRGQERESRTGRRRRLCQFGCRRPRLP